MSNPSAGLLSTVKQLVGRGLSTRRNVQAEVASFLQLDFYLRQLSGLELTHGQAVKHYLGIGWKAGLDPAADFSTNGYLERYPDVVASGANPLIHYIRHGIAEGRVAPGAVRFLEGRLPEIAPEDLALITANFDSGFYNYQTDRQFSLEDGVSHYLSAGWMEGHDPARNFSTKKYLQTHDDVATSGKNPFLHYLQFGVSEGRTVYPSEVIVVQAQDYQANPADFARIGPRVDAAFYNRQTGRAYSQAQAVQHYMNIGWKQGLDPSPDFSTKAYLDHNLDVVEAGMNPLLHFVVYGEPAGRQAISSNVFLAQPAAREKISESAVDLSVELALVSENIDVDFYSKQVPGASFSPVSAAKHYIETGWREGLNPSPDFSTDDYLLMYPDIRGADVVPYWHYLIAGKAEGRQGKSNYSITGRQDPLQILADIKNKVVDGVTEWQDYSYVWSKGLRSLEDQTPDLEAIAFTVAFAGMDPVKALESTDLSLCATIDTKKVDVSIIIPTINESQVLVECLASIANAATPDISIEVIVVDNASTDAVYTALQHHKNIKYVRFEENVGFGNACNAGADAARGKYLFFLNNDAQIAPGCLERLIATQKSTKAGIVGPKLLSFDGRLQEAGCLLNLDGTGSLIGYAQNPNTPRYNYQRRVDHVSGAAILMLRSLFKELKGFDPVYAPAYCEDADLSLKVRTSGLDIIYDPVAVVAHHLSKTSNASSDKARTKKQRIARNRQTLVQKWNGTLAENALRTIAFYLPQYHPIPENNSWWGNGFTEWTNSTRARPNYEGHLQPRYPADLGYYDLRLTEVMKQQAELARRYGLSGFCYYYYSFDGKRLLETPLENMLMSGEPDFPFCLCWANENWTKRWDGHSKDVLMKQSYSEASATVIAQDLMRYCRASNYIKVDGRPLILIYRVSELPNPKRTITTWRNVARSEGIGEIMIASVESFGLSSQPEDPTVWGCDIAVEFPPHEMVASPPLNVEKTNPDWTGTVHDYRELAINYMTRKEAGFKRLRSVLVGWDNTPRYRERSMILEKANPGGFQAWLEWTMQRTLEQNYGDERLVFINAWNEWCEGSYLEPDQHFGHGYLQALKNAIENVSTGGKNFVN